MKLAPSGANSQRAAFTLLELLAVTAVIAILTGIAIGIGRQASEAGKVARAKAELAALSAALEVYRRDFGDYPQTDDEARLVQSLIGRRSPLNTVISARNLLETARFTLLASQDPFMDSSAVLMDPWDQAYRYVYRTQAPWSNSSYVLYSVGPDGLDSDALLPGGFPDVTAIGNTDNIYANR